MLNILVTEHPGDNVYEVITYLFNDEWKPEWIDSDFAKAVISDIDKSEVVNGVLIKSPVLGMISPRDLAGGTKRILLAKYYMPDNDMYLSITNCGDNCAKWLQRIGAEKDVNLQTEVCMFFEDNEHWPIRIVNSGKLAYSYKEFAELYGEAKCEEFKKYM